MVTRRLPIAAAGFARTRLGLGGEEVRINVLGPLEVRHGGELIPLTGMKQRVFLSSLALNPRAAVPVSVLIDALWGAVPPRTARIKVHTHVSDLRKRLGPYRASQPDGWPVVTGPGGYQLSSDIELDSWEFEDNASRARQASRLSEYGQASELFARAMAMWRGPALADVDSDAIRAAASALNAKRLLAIEGKAEADLQLGWLDEVVADLVPVAAANPLRERLRGQLMLALYRRGCRNEALAVYRDGHQAISRELGLPPGPQLRRLQQFVYRDDPALWTQPPDSLLTMGTIAGEA